MTRPSLTVLDRQLCFVVASPRSGTTILGSVLGGHPDCTHWYEPYFIWDKNFKAAPDDLRRAEDASPAVIAQIREDFARFLSASGRACLVEKNPRNALKVGLMRSVFPEARWIHLYRDGRDVAASILTKSDIRRKTGLATFLDEALTTLRRQPYWWSRFKLVAFELMSGQRLIPYFKSEGARGRPWGPRFPGWREARETMSPVVYAATQWRHCEESIQAELAQVPAANVLPLSYESMVGGGEETVARICAFLDIPHYPELRLGGAFLRESVGKGQRTLDARQLAEIAPIVYPVLKSLGYEN